MTLLEVIREYCKREGLRQPNAAISSNDAQVLQMVALLNKLLDDLMINHSRFSRTIVEETWTSTGVEIQGTITSLFPGYLWLMPKSFYDRTASINIRGPLTPEEWQKLKSLAAYNSAYPSYRFIGNNLHLYPIVDVTHTLAVEYKTEACVTSASGTLKKYFTVDTDTFNLNDSILILGLEYLWRQKKGMEYEPAQDMYIKAIRSLGSQDGQRTQMDMGAEMTQLKPGIYIPDSNWPL